MVKIITMQNLPCALKSLSWGSSENCTPVFLISLTHSSSRMGRGRSAAVNSGCAGVLCSRLIPIVSIIQSFNAGNTCPLNLYLHARKGITVIQENVLSPTSRLANPQKEAYQGSLIRIKYHRLSMQNLNAGTIPFWKIDVVVKFHGPISGLP